MAKQGELLPKGVQRKVAPGRTVQGDLRDLERLYGPGQTVEVSEEDDQRLTRLGFLADAQQGASRPLDVEDAQIIVDEPDQATITQ